MLPALVSHFKNLFAVLWSLFKRHFMQKRHFHFINGDEARSRPLAQVPSKESPGTSTWEVHHATGFTLRGGKEARPELDRALHSCLLSLAIRCLSRLL